MPAIKKQLQAGWILSLPLMCVVTSAALVAQSTTSSPIAIISVKGKNAPQVTGSLDIAAGKVMIGASGGVTAGNHTADVILPRRGTLKVCASTHVQLAAGSILAGNDLPGLMMAIDRGAIEASYATVHSADVLLTPDFRIRLDGIGAADVKVRLGHNGDTCIENSSDDEQTVDVVVTGVFEAGSYRVEPGQRVMFEHGSVHEVVDEEKEPCGCPLPTKPGSNEFPLAQSAGLEPLPAPADGAVSLTPGQPSEALAYNAAKPAAKQPETSATVATKTPPEKPTKIKKFFHRVGHFFGKIFGAEE